MCGILGIIGVDGAAGAVAHGLQNLQHRGQESTGIASSNGKRICRDRKIGMVSAAFRKVDFSTELPGRSAIGHIRYATAGKAAPEPDTKSGIQPLRDNSLIYPFAVAHNGNIPDATRMLIELEQQGSILASQSDTELFLHLIKLSRAPTFPEKILDCFGKISGAYSLLILTRDRLFAAVDPHGFRPLCWAPCRGGFIIASETCALDLFEIRPQDVVHVDPGTLLEFADGMSEPKVTRFASSEYLRGCSFEWVYFARPDSVFRGVSVSQARELMGRILARDFPVASADLVIPVPDSASCHARGYALELGLPYDNNGLVRSHSIARTFIDPGEERRAAAVRLKLNPDPGVVRGKRLVVVDDSLVRGNTTKEIVRLLRNAGAIEVHLRMASPPVIGPCSWGIDTATRGELIANRMTKDEIAAFVGADSLEYLSIRGLRQALGDIDDDRHCFSCFTGEHPTRP